MIESSHDPDSGLGSPTMNVKSGRPCAIWIILLKLECILALGQLSFPIGGLKVAEVVDLSVPDTLVKLPIITILLKF